MVVSGMVVDTLVVAGVDGAVAEVVDGLDRKYETAIRIKIITTTPIVIPGFGIAITRYLAWQYSYAFCIVYDYLKRIARSRR